MHKAIATRSTSMRHCTNGRVVTTREEAMRRSHAILCQWTTSGRKPRGTRDSGRCRRAMMRGLRARRRGELRVASGGHPSDALRNAARGGATRPAAVRAQRGSVRRRERLCREGVTAADRIAVCSLESEFPGGRNRCIDEARGQAARARCIASSGSGTSCTLRHATTGCASSVDFNSASASAASAASCSS